MIYILRGVELSLHLFTKIMKSRGLNLCVRLCLGSIFIYAGLIKLIDPKAFARVISLYDIVPESFLPFIAVGLPAIEFLSGLGLIFNLRGSLTAIFSLLVVFTVVLGYGVLSNLNIDCGCFSPEEITQQNSLKTAFYRDLVLIGGAFFLYLSKLYSRRVPINQSISEKINQ